MKFLKSILIQLLKYRRIRFLVVKYRYLFLKKNMRFYDGDSSSIAQKTVAYNLTAFDSASGFGCGQRMGLLIYPIVAYNTSNKIDRSKLKILIVGCRTEDDLFWMKAYGFKNTLGLDLFSYSKYILLGDIHKTDFPDDSFDVILLGFMIAYSRDPFSIIKECKRILKPNGLLGISLDYIAPEKMDPNLYSTGEISNSLNSSEDIISLLDSTIKHKVLFEYDHYNQKDGDFGVAVVSICN